MPQLYFLCTGNSCRSQMAEGFARQLAPQDWQIASAGIEQHGLNPLAVKVMAERGVDISQQRSKLIDQDYLQHSDLVVTLCGDARDKCPMTPPTVAKQHWPLRDPAQATGSEEDVLAVFRQVRDEIEDRVKRLIATLN
ncbi:arsenate reductase (thioredoxin) [Levilactobacillus tujiorum]|uniref:Arsenate reductase (Thioredoxin) n=1 Tax=Levilactobacillus tujiorum TaxID=2912243 RepID=A0ABX1L9Z1_9LACO|nr:arsenate reductase (thioredoxin) [Levilactobacillus tujiorum]MCH5465755.1 arsenate reductase (thioredoxin) [Levilactobacillus tujiorum]NLR12952.1 arsenate reductase (thioredoxin) [Lactobacillus sp. HBUAS51387]NLR30782.1 arsenate reductase (thioredoxin) [Levilactobacillus tujiorum]